MRIEQIILILIAFITALAALVVAGINYCQLKHSRFALGTDLILKLEDKFDVEMKERRCDAAKAIKDKESLKAVEPVLDFFETIGLLVRKKAIDRYLVWHSFAYWIIRYSVLTEDHIQARRKELKDITLYHEFEILCDTIFEIEIKERKTKRFSTLSKTEIDEFIYDEIDEGNNC